MFTEMNTLKWPVIHSLKELKTSNKEPIVVFKRHCQLSQIMGVLHLQPFTYRGVVCVCVSVTATSAVPTSEPELGRSGTERKRTVEESL